MRRLSTCSAIMILGLASFGCTGNLGPGVDDERNAESGGSGGEGGGLALGGGTADGGAGGQEPLMCSDRILDCDDAVDGCETDITSDSDNCAACGNACADGPNGTGICVDARCDLECAVETGNCNGFLDDGCETDTSSDPLHCGGCGNPCDAPFASTAACSAGTCTYTCVDDFLDCNGDAIDGCEAYSLSNESHCGGCNNVCPAENGTAECSLGTCVVRLGEIPIGYVQDLEVSGGFVYIAGSSATYRVSTSGGTPVQIAAGGGGGSTINRFLEVVGDTVFFTVNDQAADDVLVKSVPLAGGTVTDIGLVDGGFIANPHGFTVGDTYAYVCADGWLSALPLAGGAPTQLSNCKRNPVIEGAELFFVANGSTHTLRSMPLGGGAATVVGTGAIAWSVAVDAAYGYLAGTTGLYRISRVDGTVVNLTGDIEFPRKVVSDGTHVYIYAASTSDANLLRVPVAGGTVEALAPLPKHTNRGSLAVDATHVYWGYNDRIRKMPK